MKRDLIKKEIDDLQYKMNLEKYAFERAKYNLQHADILCLEKKQIREYCSNLDKYAMEYTNNKRTFDVLDSYYSSCTSNNTCDDSNLLFKCTFPSEKTEWNAPYQSSVVVSEDVAKLFANGVDYKKIIRCFDNEDILGINTELDSNEFTYNKNGNVDVELAMGLDCIPISEKPIIACKGDATYGTVVAESKVPYCLPIGEVSLSDLNGESYSIVEPSFSEIETLKNTVSNKKEDLGRLMGIEAIARYKMDTTINRMNLVLDDVDKYNKLK